MIGRRAVLGLSLLSALLFCAFAAQSASAAKAVNTTAFTCAPATPGTGDFGDAHCDEKKTGNFKHDLIPLNETTAVAATNEKVTNSTKDSEPATLTGKIGLTATEIHCNKVKFDTTKSFIHNVETESKKHTLTGTARVEYTDCSVSKPLKCDIAEPLIWEANFEGVEKLGPLANTMGIEFKGEKAEETFTEILYTGAECALKNQTFKVKGSAIATSGPGTEASQSNKWAGATLAFTPKNEMQKLKLGANTVELHSILTPSMSGGNPIAATTTT